MNKITIIARYLLGIIFTFSGFTGLLMVLGISIFPEPEMSFKMGIVMKGFNALGYLLPLVKIIEIVAGIMLLTNRYVNLALVSLAPIVINILGINLFVDQAGLLLAAIVTTLLMVLMLERKKDLKVLFKR